MNCLRFLLASKTRPIMLMRHSSHRSCESNHDSNLVRRWDSLWNIHFLFICASFLSRNVLSISHIYSEPDVLRFPFVSVSWITCFFCWSWKDLQCNKKSLFLENSVLHSLLTIFDDTHIHAAIHPLMSNTTHIFNSKLGTHKENVKTKITVRQALPIDDDCDDGDEDADLLGRLPRHRQHYHHHEPDCDQDERTCVHAHRQVRVIHSRMEAAAEGNRDQLRMRTTTETMRRNLHRSYDSKCRIYNSREWDMTDLNCIHWNVKANAIKIIRSQCTWIILQINNCWSARRCLK